MTDRERLPVVVVLPGLDGTGRLLDGFRDELATTFRTEVLSYPAEQWNYDEIERYVCERLPDNRPFVLVAESFAGPIAIKIASRKPVQIVGVVFVATFATRPRDLHRNISWLIKVVPIRSMLALKIAAPLLVGRWGSDAILKNVFEVLKGVSKSSLKNRIGEVLDVDRRAELSDICVPALYLGARQDRLVPRKASEPFLKVVPDIRDVWIDAPHFALQTRPEACAEVIRNFVGQIDR